MGIWSMATRVTFSGRVTSLPAWSVMVRVDEAVVSWVVCSDWLVVAPEPPEQAVRARVAVARIAVSVARRVFIASSRVSGITREMLHNIRWTSQD